MGAYKAKYSTNIGDLKDLAGRIKMIITDIYEAVTPSEIKTRKGVERMVMSDVEIITVAILGELMTIDSKRAWYSFKQDKRINRHSDISASQIQYTTAPRGKIASPAYL